MFKKFKDKLAEEMKQSPARIQASMQQLAQAVVSPNISNVSSSGLSSSNDNFSLTDEGDETAKNSPAKDYFPSIDLTSLSSNTTGLSRSSSINSLASGDTSGLFPIFESSGSAYHFQSDVEQSASETDECMNRQMDQVSKDEIYSAYRKIQTKYFKYRGKYRELANHYREIERVKQKLESLLVETQNKALRRIGNLKEQCQLEQQAKAHLEEALRNDIEEKDHIIDSLNTKVKLLQANGANSRLENQLNLDENQLGSTRNSTQDLIKISGEEMEDISLKSNQIDSELLTENNQLKNKLEKFEILISKYKESLKRSKEKIEDMEEEKYKTEKELDMMKNLNEERLDELKEDLNEAKEKIDYLNEEINELRKREEESVISLAENKFKIHKELEIKEEQIKQLTLQLKNAMQNKEKIDFDEKNHENSEEVTRNENLIDIDSDTEIKIETRDRENKISELNKLIDENKNQNLEISTLRQQLYESSEKIAALNNKIRENEKLFDNYKQDKVEKERVFVEKIVNYVAIMQELKKTCREMKMQVNDSNKHVQNQFLNVNKTIIDVLNTYEIEKNTQNDEKNNKLIAEVENLNFKIFDMEKEWKNNEDKVKLIEEEKEKLKKACNSICEEDKNEILKQKNLIMKMSEEIGVLKGKCEDQGERLNQFNKEKRSSEENIMEELEKLRKLENDCKNLGFDLNEENAGYFYSQVSEIMNENGTFRRKNAESEETLAKLMSEYEQKAKENMKLKKDLENEKIIFKTHLEKYETIEAEKKKLVEEISMLNEKIKNLEDVISVKNNIIANLEGLKKEQDCIVTDLSDKIEQPVEIKLEDNNLKHIEAFNNKIEGLMDIIVAKNNFIDKLKSVQKEKNYIIEELNNKIEELQKNVELSRKNYVSKEKLDELMSMVVEKNNYINKLKLLKDEKNNVNKQLEEKNQELQCEVENLRKNVSKDKIDELMEIIRTKNDYINQLKCVKEQLIARNNYFKQQLDYLMDLIVAKNQFIDKLRLVNKEKNNSIEELKQINQKLESDDKILKENEGLKEKLEATMDMINVKNNFIDQLKLVKKEKMKLIEELNQKNDDLLLKIETFKTNDDLIENLQIELKELKDAKNELCKSNDELKETDENARKRVKELEGLIKKNTEEMSDKAMEMEGIKNVAEAYKNQVKDLEMKIEKMNKELDEEKRKNVNDSNKKNELHEDEIKNLKSTIEKLQIQLKDAESKVNDFESKESQVESVNESLRSESDKLKKQLETIEDEQRERMNQLVKEFQAQINDKDQELQAALDKKFERQKNYESDLVQQYKEQLRDFQVELTAKSEEIESLRKNKDEDSAIELNKLTELVTRMKTEHENEIKQVETRWEDVLKSKNNEINELKKESDKSKREVETKSIETMRNTLTSQQRELTELRKLIKLRHDTLEDSTEIEYLRNILYEYMMGRETLVLAKVIAAVVKFDQEQTNRILKKEEDKLTLLGSLGLS